MKHNRILCGALCAAVLLTACNKTAPPDPLEAYQLVVEQSRQATSASMRLTYDIGMAMGDKSSEAHMQGELRQVNHSETDAEVMVGLSTSIPGQELISTTYYKDGMLYQESAGQKVRMEASLAQVLAQIEPAGFTVPQSAIEAAEVTEREGGDMLLTFTLSPKQMEGSLWQLSQSILLSMGLPTDDYDEVSPSFGDISYSLVYSPDHHMKRSQMAFQLGLTRGEESVTLDYTIKLDDIALNTLESIDYPEDLESYRDMAVVMEEELAKLNEELAARREAPFKPVEPVFELVNTFGDKCNAAKLLEQEKEYLHYFFWLLYQTQTGLAPPETLTGFADASEISSEGLLRLFCFANDSRRETFSDIEAEQYVIPDDLPPKFFDNTLQGYQYDPATLPADYGHETGEVRFAFSLMQPFENACRVDRVEVLDEQRLKITATGLEVDGETPVNTQEIVLLCRGEGQVVFESYRIQLL